MSWVAVGVGAFQVGSSLQQASLIQGNAALNQQEANLNAKYADLDAYNATTMGYTEVSRYADVVDKTIGAQREELAGEGENVDFGTAGQVQADTKVLSVMNTIDIQNQARAKALGFEQQSRNSILQGSMQALQGGIAAQGAITQGIASGLKTGLSGYSNSNKKVDATQSTDVTGDVNNTSSLGNSRGYSLGVNTDF
jgi:hypothetical protein